MTLEQYIKDLLYRYDCVIVPDFGAFIANVKTAAIDGKRLTPPFKQITFNALIQNNDGLLANHIALSDKMPYETAINFIKFEIEEWIDKLLDEELVLEGIGTLFLNNDIINFEPDTSINYLTSSFGLSSFISDSISRNQISTVQLNDNKEKEESFQIDSNEETKTVAFVENKPKRNFPYLKYAAIFLIGAATIGLFGKKAYDAKLENDQALVIQEQQIKRETEIQTATFVINNPLPTITIKTIEPVKKYHIIAGAFRSKNNAQKKVNQLLKNGFESSIVGENKWHLTQVAFQSFSSLEEANTALAKIKNETAKDAWLLVKE